MRQSQSCDACRARKVRCVKDNNTDQKQPCKHCLAFGIPCTYDYQPKKRGPPNLYLRKLQQAQAVATASGVPPEHHDTTHSSEPSPSVSQVFTTPPQSAVSTPLHAQTQLAVMEPPLLPILSSSISPASQYPSSEDSPRSHYHSVASMSPHSSYGGSISNDHVENHSRAGYATHHQHRSPSAAIPPPTVFPPLSYYCVSHRLEDIAPRDTIHLIIARFFDFVYPLTPCIHRPSFMADLHANRAERDPLFFALVMSTIASTLVQVPRSVVPMERSAVKKLARTCFEASRHITVASYDPPSSTHVVIRYFDCCYHFCTGTDATQHAAFGEAAHIAVTLRMHEEASYEGLNPIESQVRRRAFWLLFGADKSMSILLGRPICLRDEDCTVHFPKEIDDEYITTSAYLPQPQGKTAIVSGLNYISRIFALLGEILVRIRVDKRSPPRDKFATARLEEVRTLHTRILETLDHAPPPLRLKRRLPRGVSVIGNTGSGCGTGAAPGNDVIRGCDFDDSASNLGKGEYYCGTGFRQATLGEVALNPFLVMQANVYVTQQLVRFVIEQYRDELVTYMQGSIDEYRMAADREAVASELLHILHSIPIQSIATNGPSLVHKVRFVASTLLDTVQKVDSAPVSAARAHAYLWDFLSILSEIERNYMLEDDPTQQSALDNGVGVM
ncbi:fungal-specific transcription factor domain-containing protein [Scleroderma citrinum]